MKYRKVLSATTRQLAATIANDRPVPVHIQNGDEQKFRHTVSTAALHNAEITDKPSYMMSFTKGLPHNKETGLVDNPTYYQYLVRGIDSGDVRDFRDTPLGHVDNCMGNQCANHDFEWESNKAKNNSKPVGVRAWESQGAGQTYDLEGPDAQSVTMPPLPKLGSPELTAEIAEVYTQALLRDTPFNAFTPGVVGIGSGISKEDISTSQTLNALDVNAPDVQKVKEATEALSYLKWFQQDVIPDLDIHAKRRRRSYQQTPANAFRGIAYGDNVGPYLSQFLLAGNSGINANDKERSPSKGLISYGALTVEQKVRTATKGKDHLLIWDEWYDAQNGADLRGMEDYDDTNKRRFIHSPRDLATYVHYDALYESYLNACLILMGNGVPFDPGIPFQEPDNVDHQQGFAHFGGPHILSLVTEVATRALKAVRFQKFNVHRRCRPEVVAARIHKCTTLEKMAPELCKLHDELESIGLLAKIRDHNANQNGGDPNVLLPMAFCEGSPMHPSYGAGHATVAGACVTILKAFFDHKHPLNIVPTSEAQQEIVKLVKKTENNNSFTKDDFISSNLAYVSVNDGKSLEVVPVLDQNCRLAQLTVEGELNKLASNISIGRDWAGVHYFTDYYESLLLGERIALGILEEQKVTYNENFSMSVPLFNGETIRI